MPAARSFTRTAATTTTGKSNWLLGSANSCPIPLQKSMFLQSGADANEAAINIARKYTGGFEIVSPHTSFHGMSDTTRSLTFAGWHRGYGPPQPGMMAMLAPYCYRCPIGLEPESCDTRLPRRLVRANRCADDLTTGQPS